MDDAQILALDAARLTAADGKPMPDPEPPMAWTDKYTLSDEEVAQMADPDWIIENLIIRGHGIAIVAEPNGGKTAVLMSLMPEMVAKGYEVYYVNADVSGGDVKPFHAASRAHGFTLLTPDMKTGLSMQTVVEDLLNMNRRGGDFSNFVLIFDTLKKMIRVINKNAAADLYTAIRSMTAKGATMIVLGHTNKYDDKDGNPIYEGTVDLRADMDELIYLVPEEQADGSLIVSTYPDKKRGTFEKISYRVENQQATRLGEFVDTLAARGEQKREESSEYVIDAITDALIGGGMVQKQITDYCAKEYDVGAKKVIQVLKEYRQIGDQPKKGPAHWKSERQSQNNAWYYWIEKGV